MTDLYARLGIDFDQLGCVMLDCEPPTFLHDLVPPTFWYRAAREAAALFAAITAA